MSKTVTYFLVLLVFSYGVFAMGEKNCLFSSMTGVVNYKGKPAENVRLIRKIEGKKVDETVTDEFGNFQFEVIYQKNRLLSFLPTEFAIQQIITAVRDDKEYPLWVGVKRTPEENAESRGKPLDVSCDLSLETENYVKVNDSPYFTLCTWNVEPDKEEIPTDFFDQSGDL